MMIEREVLLKLLRASVVGDTGFVIPDSLDWATLIEESSRQNVSVIASDGLQRMYDDGSYTELGDRELRRTKARWFGKTLEYEQRYASQMSATTKLGKWLAEEGIQTVILKGYTISECYPIPSHRYSADFDCFLIKDSEHLEAYELGNRVAERHGVSVSRDYYKNSSFSIGGLLVENHQFCVPFRGNKMLHKLEFMLEQMILDGPLTTFGDTGLFKPPQLVSALFIIEHAYSHFLHEGLNLRHILDWAVFRRKHESDLNWDAFGSYIDEFGFRKFYDAYSHLGEYILGERESNSLTVIEQRMMDSVWAGLDLHETVRGITGKLNLVGNTLRASWKYRQFSDISMLKALWIQVKGFLFEKNPKI